MEGRREFLKKIVCVGASFCTLPASYAFGQAVFSPATFPRSVCFGGREEFDGALQTLEGEIPNDIQGHAFTVESLDTADRSNLIAGVGALLRIDFSDGQAVAKRRLIKTASVLAQEVFENTEHRFENKSVAYLSKTLGLLNSCNTAAVAMGSDRLVLTYDAGEPYEVDLDTLKVITPIGGREEWKQGLPDAIAGLLGNPVFPMIRSTAHPFYDDENQSFITLNFGGQINLGGLTLGENFTQLLTWDGDGLLHKHPLIDAWGKAVQIKQAVHSLCVTRHYILIFDTPFSLEAEAILGFPKTRAQAADTPVWIVKRSSLDGSGASVRAQKIVLKKEWEHILADFDDSGDVITLYGATSPASDFSECLRAGDQLVQGNAPVNPNFYGMIPAPMDRGDCGRIRIDMNGEEPIVETTLTSHPLYNWSTALFATRRQIKPLEKHGAIFWVSFGFAPELALKRMYDVYANYKYRQVPAEDLPWGGISPALFRYNCESMTIERGYSFPPGYFPSSPLFLPRQESHSQTDGYILLTVASDRKTSERTGDEIWIFESQTLHAGPICKLHHSKLDMALTLHTEWLDEMEPRRSHYKVDMRKSYGDILASKPQDVQAEFDSKIFPLFD